MICFCYQDRYASLEGTNICCQKSTAAKQKRKQIILKMFEIMFTPKFTLTPRMNIMRNETIVLELMKSYRTFFSPTKVHFVHTFGKNRLDE